MGSASSWVWSSAARRGSRSGPPTAAMGRPARAAAGRIHRHCPSRAQRVIGRWVWSVFVVTEDENTAVEVGRVGF